MAKRGVIERRLEDAERAAIEALSAQMRVKLKIKPAATPEDVIALDLLPCEQRDHLLAV